VIRWLEQFVNNHRHDASLEPVPLDVLFIKSGDNGIYKLTRYSKLPATVKTFLKAQWQLVKPEYSPDDRPNDSGTIAGEV
jgi:hypothetical protein